MPCSRKLLVITSCALLVCTGVSSDAGDKKDKDKSKPSPGASTKGDKKSDDKKSDGKKSKKGSAQPEEGQSKLVIPLPKGQDSKGVTIPYTDANGKKSMVFKIGVGTRVDETHVKMNDVVIETYDDKGAQEMTIALPSSVLDMEARVITGDESVTIDRSDFKITGKDMQFNTETRQGWIKGNVKMIIYDLSEETGNEKPAAPAPTTESTPSKGS